MPTCECGCGGEARNRFIIGHNSSLGKGRKHPSNCAHCVAVLGKPRPDISGDRSPMRRPDVAARQLERTPRGTDHPSSKAADKMCYKAVHTLHRRTRWIGVCEECGEQADDLALIHGRGTLKDSRNGRLYSPNRDDYRELCKSCHRRYDGSTRVGPRAGNVA